MKALAILHFLPYPLVSGAHLRTFNALKLLARTYQLDILAFRQKVHLATNEEVREAEDALRSFAASVRSFPVPTDSSKRAWLTMLAANTLSPEPYSLWRFRSAEMSRAINDAISKNDYDVIHVDTIALAPYVADLPAPPRVLVHHNVESALLLRRARTEKSPFARSYVTLQGRKLKRYEQRVLPAFDLNIAVSDEDARSLNELAPSANVKVMPNGTDTDYFEAAPSPAEGRPQLLFVGTMTWYPNQDGMLFFIREVYPEVRAALPDVRLRIVGKAPGKELDELASADPSISLEGFVDDVRPLLRDATAFIVPLRVGGGTRLKILDAMASGKAVVSTTIGAEGLAVRDGHDILIADTAAAFASAVVNAVKDLELRRSLERNARETVETKYSWDVLAPLQDSLYRSILKPASVESRT